MLDVEGIDFLPLPDLGLDEHIDLGVRELGKVLGAYPADLIYLPHPEESHPDHAAVLPIVRTALARLPEGVELPELWAYEIWSPMTRHDWVEDISKVMRQQLRAVRCYRVPVGALPLRSRSLRPEPISWYSGCRKRLC